MIRFLSAVLLEDLGHSEVEDLRAFAAVPEALDEDVGRLQVSVDHARAVRGGQALEHIGDERRQLRERHFDLSFQSIGEALAREELEHEIQLSRGRATGVEQGAHVGTLHTRGDERFALEPCDELRLPGRFLQQQLDGHRPLRPRVGRGPHLAHASAAERMLDAEPVIEEITRADSHDQQKGITSGRWFVAEPRGSVVLCYPGLA